MTDCTALAAVAGALVLTPGSQFGDRIVLAPHATAVAEVCVWNSAPAASHPGVFALSLDGVTVTVTVQVNAAGDAERVGIEVPVGFYVWPADAAVSDLPDGQSVRALILGGVS